MNLSLPLFNALGLSNPQARVYLAALETGEATIQELARSSGVKRTSIYNFIGELVERQVLTATRKGRRNLYRAVNPEHLAETLKMRMLEFDQVLPKLVAVHQRARKGPRVTFYEGVEGIKEVFTDALREAAPIIAWTDWESMMATMGDYVRLYPAERARRGIKFKQIARDTPIARQIGKHDKKELRSTKYLKTRELSTEIMIYGEKVAIMSFGGKPPLGIIIQDRSTAETLRVGWEALWERLP